MKTFQKIALFWDVDRDLLDETEHADFIIRRVLSFGDTDDVRWMVARYGTEKVSSVLAHARDLDSKSQSFWHTHFTYA